MRWKLWRWAVCAAAVASVAEVACDALALPALPLPLADVGLGWVCPVLVAALLAFMVPNNARKELT